MTITIPESELTFGPYKKSDVFWIEKSDLFKALGKGIKTVEFILWRDNKKMVFVEAKSRAPQPGNKQDFDSFIEKISLKFTHALNLFFSTVLQRCTDQWNELPKYVDAATCSTYNIELILVIREQQETWLPPVRDALNKALLAQRKIWKLNEVVILNEALARQHHLIQ